MFILDYIKDSITKGTIGSYISIGLFALVGIYAIIGMLFGARRGFSKSVIRLFTVVASAVLSFISLKWILYFIIQGVTNATGNGADTIDEVLNSFSPKIMEIMPDAVRIILAEINSKTAVIFGMMITTLLLAPILFIFIFNILKIFSLLIYTLLSGLTGAISYGKGFVSTIFGAVVGAVQGVIIAAVIILPISGLCHVATEARDPLIGDSHDDNRYLNKAYTEVVDDLATNPRFDLIDKLGGKDIYEDMLTVVIDGEKMYMGEKCIGAVKVVADIAPLIDNGFDWQNPSEEERAALSQIVTDVGNDDLVGTLVADVMRGVSTAVVQDKIPLGLSGAVDALVDDVMTMFSTSTADTIEGDLDVVVDIYFIMCDHNLFNSFTNSEHDIMRDMLTTRDESGKTISDVIISRLNEYERSQPIITSFTKISLSVMHGSQDFGAASDELYESVKGGVSNALSHNKSDYETEEEYKAAVEDDLDKALLENNITVDDSVKANMVDYIAENYGDHEGEITDKEINDALLSYYSSYASSQDGSGSAE